MSISKTENPGTETTKTHPVIITVITMMAAMVPFYLVLTAGALGFKPIRSRLDQYSDMINPPSRLTTDTCQKAAEHITANKLTATASYDVGTSHTTCTLTARFIVIPYSPMAHPPTRLIAQTCQRAALQITQKNLTPTASDETKKGKILCNLSAKVRIVGGSPLAPS